MHGDGDGCSDGRRNEKAKRCLTELGTRSKLGCVSYLHVMIVEQKALRPSHCAPRPRSTEQRLRVRYFCPTRLMADGGREQDERGPELEHGRCLRRPTVSKFPQRTPTHLPEVHRYLHSSSSDWRCGFEAGQLDAGRGVDAGRAPLCSLHDHLGCHRSGRPPTPPWPRTIYCVSNLRGHWNRSPFPPHVCLGQARQLGRGPIGNSKRPLVCLTWDVASAHPPALLWMLCP